MTEISIIIPTAGRPTAIKAAIASVLNLSIEQDGAELLVIDNNTQEDLSSDLSAYCGTLGRSVRCIREPSPGLGAARHRGVLESAGDILVFLDDDVEVSEGWLRAIKSGFKNDDVGMVGGPSIPNFTDSIPPWFWHYLSNTPYGGWMSPWLSLLDIGRDVTDIDPNYVWGLNFSIRKELVTKCGGFHPDLVPSAMQRWQGDGETGLTRKFAESGYRADYLHGARLKHLCGPDRLNEQYFAKRAYYQGVADSFTSIRQGNPPQVNSLPISQASTYSRAKKALRAFIPRRELWTKGLNSVHAAVDAAYVAGWRFHQAEAAQDGRLLNWIRRTDFWDADIRSELV